MENIINFFIQNKFKLADYFKQIKINQKKTVVKFESTAENKISITFLIYGEPQKKEIPFEDKVRRLFNTKEDLSILDQIIGKIDKHYYFSYLPGKKISEENEPLVWVFQVNIVFEKI